MKPLQINKVIYRITVYSAFLLIIFIIQSAAFAEVGYGISNPFDLRNNTNVAQKPRNVRSVERPAVKVFAGETLRIEITGNMPFKNAILYDLAGKKITDLATISTVSGNTVSLCFNADFIKANGLTAGVYFVVLRNNKKKNTLTQKIILISGGRK